MALLQAYGGLELQSLAYIDEIKDRAARPQSAFAIHNVIKLVSL